MLTATMLERHLLEALIGLTLVFTLWHIAVGNGSHEIYRDPEKLAENQNGQLPLATPQQSMDMSLVNPADPLPQDDYTKLIDLKDFTFTINLNNCSRSDDRPVVLVLVHSAPTNWNKRSTIRDTWGRHDPRAKLVFLLGTVNTVELQRRIEQENQQYKDIVQGSFVDAYRNMTYKHVMALKWFFYHCPVAKYILKADDDVFVNTPALYDVLSGLQTPRKRLLFCQEIRNPLVMRTPDSKWFVSFEEYGNRHYPNYCKGYAILYSADVAQQLYREAMRQTYFWIDDVHITGTIVQRINERNRATVASMTKEIGRGLAARKSSMDVIFEQPLAITPADVMMLDKNQNDAIVEGRANATEQLFFFSTPELGEGEIRKLWKAVTEVE